MERLHNSGCRAQIDLVCMQILDNCKCLEVVPKLTPEVMAELDEALGTKP